MPPVLFIPEIAVYAGISALRVGVRAALTVIAMLIFLALYGAIRLVAGKSRTRYASVAGAVAVFGVFASLALLEGEPGRQGFQPASLLATTTYYSSTLLGAVVTVGLIRRTVDKTPVVCRTPAAASIVVWEESCAYTLHSSSARFFRESEEVTGRFWSGGIS